MANMVVWIAGQKWKIRHCKVPPNIHGDCNYQRRTIRISDKLAGEDRLNTLIHEVVHARFPDLAEDPVSEFADTLAAIVHHAGFRSEEEEENGD
jgi:hypothetical protein